MLYSKGVFINKCYDELNLRNPEIVLEVHRAVREGRRGDHRDQHLRREPREAARLRHRGRAARHQHARARRSRARRPATRVYVAGAIGPLGIRIEPYGPTVARRGARRSSASRRRRCATAASICSSARRSRTSPRSSRPSPRSATSASLPVVAQMTIGVDGRTIFGDTPRDVAQRLDRAGADVIGLNCSVGPDVMLDAIEEIAAVTAKKISCQPNAGLPRDVNGRQMYMASPDYFGKYAKRLIHKGVKFIGGCCGTTPEHIKMMADAVRPLSPRRSFVIVESERRRRREDRRASSRRRWRRARTGDASSPRGEFVTTIEITPPKGAEPRRDGRSRCTSIKAAGVDAVNVPDGPRAQNRMGAIAVAGAAAAARRHRDRASLLLPRPQSPRHALRSPRLRRARPAQPAAHHRRSSEDGPVPRGDGGVRHRLDRPDEHGQPDEPRPRPRRQSVRRADVASRSAWA